MIENLENIDPEDYYPEDYREMGDRYFKGYPSDNLDDFMQDNEDSDRPCTCGSGQPWTTCSANSSYCG